MTWLDPLRRRLLRPHRLRAYLTGLVLAVLLPTLAAGAFALWRTAESYTEASGLRLVDTARTLAHALERDLSAKTALMATDALDVVRLVPGARLSHDLLPPDVASGWQTDGRAALTNLFGDPPQVALVARDASGRPVVARMRPGQLVALAPQDGPDPSSLLVAVTDGNGRILARSRDAERLVGQRVPDWDKVRLHPDARGLFDASTAEGAPVKFAFQRLRGTPGWVVVAGEPLDTLNAGWRRLQNQLLLGGAVAVAFGLALATLVAQRVLRPVAALARDAQAAAAGERAVPGPVQDLVPSVAEFVVLHERFWHARAALQQRADDARRNADALAISERRYRRLAEAGALVLWRSTHDGRLIAATGWEPLTGEPEARALGLAWLAAVHEDDRRAVRAALRGSSAGGQDLDIEFRLRAREGHRWVRVRGAFVSPAGGGAGEWVGALEDIDERRTAQAHAAHLARHDPLTQLPNRTHFRERLASAVAGTASGPLAAVLCIDLDRFKEVNDTLGHPAGDALLKLVAQRLRHLLRDGDTAARMGGDEFAVVQVGLQAAEQADALAARIVASLGAPYDLGGHPAVIGASVGIAVADGPHADPDRLVAQADVALYAAKDAGRGAYRRHDAALAARHAARPRPLPGGMGVLDPSV